MDGDKGKGKEIEEVEKPMFTIGSDGSGDYRTVSDYSDDDPGLAAPETSRRVDLRVSNSGFNDPRPSSSSVPPAAQRIGPFEDGQYVRLLNRGRGGYLFANESGQGVSVDHRRGMVNTAWAVQVMRAARVERVFLRGAYGRYLGATRNSARFGLLGCYAEQRLFESLDEHGIWWSVVMGRCGSVVLLDNMEDKPRALRANGRYQRWNTEVTVGAFDSNHVSSMMEWEVQVIPLTLERPPYQPRSIRWWRGSGMGVGISFTHPWVGGTGRLEWQGWMTMHFHGRSLTELGNAIASQMGNGVQFENMTLCVQAGRLGRPTPLLTDLPFIADPIIILVYLADTPGHGALRFPNLAAE